MMGGGGREGREGGERKKKKEKKGPHFFQASKKIKQGRSGPAVKCFGLGHCGKCLGLGHLSDTWAEGGVPWAEVGRGGELFSTLPEVGLEEPRVLA